MMVEIAGSESICLPNAEYGQEYTSDQITDTWRLMESETYVSHLIRQTAWYHMCVLQQRKKTPQCDTLTIVKLSWQR